MAKASDHFPCLDGLRALSIAFVVFAHGLPATSALAHWGEVYAQLGVRTFFVLSGFLITSLLMREQERRGRVSLRNFYMRRTLRLFPAFYTFLAVMALLSWLGYVDLGARHFVVAGLYVWNYAVVFLGAADMHVALGHTWSLAMEEQFYLLWPMVFLTLRGVTRMRLLAVLIVLMPMVRVMTYYLQPELRGSLILMLHSAADPILIGCLLALMMKHPAWARIEARLLHTPLVIAVTVFGYGVSQFLAVVFRGNYYATIGPTLDALSIALIIAWLLKHPQSLPGRILESRPFVHVGKLSYSIYLWQQLYLLTFREAVVGVFPLNVGLSYVTALCSYYFVEMPFLKLKKRFK